MTDEQFVKKVTPDLLLNNKNNIYFYTCNYNNQLFKLGNEVYLKEEIDYSFENNKLILTGISENAKIKEELATIQEGENLKISLNVKFLVDYISIIGGKVTELKLLNSKSSVVVKDEADDKSVYFTMPLALRE